MRILLNVKNANKNLEETHLTIVEAHSAHVDTIVYLDDGQKIQVKACLVFEEIGNSTSNNRYYVLFDYMELAKKQIKELFATGLLDLSKYDDGTIMNPNEADLSIIKKFKRNRF